VWALPEPIAAYLKAMIQRREEVLGYDKTKIVCRQWKCCLMVIG
jgi:hypothetical protein